MKDWTQKQVQSAPPGRHRIAASLYLYVSPDTGTRRFMFRYTKPRTGRVSEFGLGTLGVTSLAEARSQVLDCLRMVKQGQDPVEAKREAKLEARRTIEAGRTFGSVVDDFIAVQERRYRNPGSRRT
jgi:hypothetical protein